MSDRARGRKKDDSTWVLFSLRVPPVMKAMIERRSMNEGFSQSEMVRSAIDEYLISHSTEDWEKRAAEVAADRRKETIKLTEAKDGYRTEMQISSAWNTIQNAKKNFQEMGILRDENYATWIRRLELNIESINEHNPERDMAIAAYRLLIEKLGEERAQVFPQGID